VPSLAALRPRPPFQVLVMSEESWLRESIEVASPCHTRSAQLSSPTGPHQVESEQT
jgi:hypothetical protein